MHEREYCLRSSLKAENLNNSNKAHPQTGNEKFDTIEVWRNVWARLSRHFYYSCFFTRWSVASYWPQMIIKFNYVSFICHLWIGGSCKQTCARSKSGKEKFQFPNKNCGTENSQIPQTRNPTQTRTSDVKATANLLSNKTMESSDALSY